MLKPTILVIGAALLLLPAATPRQSRKGRIPCKTEAIAASCYWTHGQLTYGNGTPALRLWKRGTNRLLGIYSGPSVHVRRDERGDNEHPDIPPNISRELNPGKTILWADFEVCPLEPEKPGTMQAACIESAKNVFVEKLQ